MADELQDQDSLIEKKDGSCCARIAVKSIYASRRSTSMGRYKSGTAEITVDYGYDVHTLKISQRTLQRAQSGAKFTVRGHGFQEDDRRSQDFWLFNAEGPGTLHVYCENGREVFHDKLSEAVIELIEDSAD